MPFPLRPLAVLSLGLLLTGACSTTEEKVHVAVETRDGKECNPLSMGVCVLPVPSSVWQRSDAATPTGQRLALPEGLLPAATVEGKAIPLDPAPYNEKDGWSIGTSIYIAFDRAVDGVNLAGYAEIARTVDGDSPTVLLDAETGERVAHWAELDEYANLGAKPGKTDRGLLIRPAGTLEFNRRYVVALRRSLEGTAGPFEPPAAFKALRDGTLTDNATVERLRPRYTKIFAALAKAGIAKDDLLLAWDFDTGSDGHLHRDLIAMRDRALDALGDDGIGYTIEKVELLEEDNPVRMRVTGTFKSPLFLENGGEGKSFLCTATFSGACPPEGYVRDEQGLPKQLGTWDRPFLLTIPRRATEATVPIVQFGHGLLGGADEINSGYNRRVAEELGIAFLATDWTGMSFLDVPLVGAALLDMSKFAALPLRQTQGLIDAIALTRTSHRIAKDAQLQLNGKPLLDSSVPRYYGISLGGILGGPFMAISTDIERGVLNVPGGAWSLMITRSSNWSGYSVIMNAGYPDKLDQQIVLVLLQTVWDISDPVAFAPKIIRDPLPGTPAKKILYQMAVNDAQVPMESTEKMARGMGLPLIVPSVRDVYGLEEVTEAESALTIWDENVTPMPIENLPPTETNETHGSIRDLPELKAQIDDFLFGDGIIRNTCGGPCNYVNDVLTVAP